MRNKQFLPCRPLARRSWRMVGSAAGGHLAPYGFGTNHQENLLIHGSRRRSPG
ncbi:hypothetical protein ACF1G4_14210 [Streptomyces caelestis]